VSVYITKPARQPDGKEWCLLCGTDVKELERFAEDRLGLSSASRSEGTVTVYFVPGERYGTALRGGAKPIGADVLAGRMRKARKAVVCPDCDGDGRIPDKTGGGHHGTCPTCDGTGVIGEEVA